MVVIFTLCTPPPVEHFAPNVRLLSFEMRLCIKNNLDLKSIKRTADALEIVGGYMGVDLSGFAASMA